MQSLNLTAATAISSVLIIGSGPIWLDEVGCDGTETRLVDCTHAGFGNHNCLHTEDAGVRCTGLSCTQGDIRLIEGSITNQGRVEVCNANVWGTVCDDSWGDVDARVACSQLGLPSSSKYRK